MTRLPRAVWITRPDGRTQQVWVDHFGDEYQWEIDVSDCTVPSATGELPELEFSLVPMGRVTTPRIDELMLATLLVRCER
jgi:hypothetical protein